MRNVFDQYSQPENRLTHALVCALAEDRALLRRFMRFVLGRAAPPSRGLQIVEQQLPGDAPLTEDASKKLGIPDAWVFNDRGWALVIESKVAATLRAGQLRSHLKTARRRGFEDVRMLAITAVPPKVPAADGTRLLLWPDLYVWLRRQAPSSEWAARVADYMEVLEGKMIGDGYLKEGALTVFSGIPFNKDNPYTYREAKRVLGLAMRALRERRDLVDVMGVDADAPGRPAITGRSRTSVWDYLQLKVARKAKTPQKFPHLTFSIQQEKAQVQMTFPNALRADLRRNLLSGGRGGFVALMTEVTERLIRAHEKTPGAVPWAQLVQRHYRSQRSAPIADGELTFDLRTAVVGQSRPTASRVKYQPQWLDATYSALAHRRSNMQLGVGAVFPYERCSAIGTEKALDAFAATWEACKPLLDAALGKA